MVVTPRGRGKDSPSEVGEIDPRFDLWMGHGLRIPFREWDRCGPRSETVGIVRGIVALNSRGIPL
jgi:hypothetical protein